MLMTRMLRGITEAFPSHVHLSQMAAVKGADPTLHCTPVADLQGTDDVILPSIFNA
jgi:hypothetical protein